MRDLLNEILAEKTGQTPERIARDTDRDFILEAEAAKEYGVVDHIIESRKGQERVIR
jgi:ATP-dependent Clp protease, protease subunit